MRILKHIGIFTLLLIPFLFFTGIFYASFPLPWPDEAIYLDVAKNLLHSGHLATNIFHGAIEGLDKIALWYPPLFFYLLAGWIKLFGTSLEAMRALPFVSSLIALGVFYILSLLLFGRKSLAALATLMCSLDVWFFQASHIARMDMTDFLFVISAILFYILYIKKDNKIYLFLASACSSLAFLTHPLGLIGPATIFTHILFAHQTKKEKIKALAVFLLPLFFTVTGYYLTILPHFALFLVQQQAQYTRKALETSYFLVFVQSNIIYVSIYIIYALFFLRFIKKHLLNRPTTIDILLAMLACISFVVVFIGKEEWYIFYFNVTAPLIVIRVLQETPKNKKIYKIGIACLIGLLVLAYQRVIIRILPSR